MRVVDAGKQILIAVLCWVQEDTTFACCRGVAHARKRGKQLGLWPVSLDEEGGGDLCYVKSSWDLHSETVLLTWKPAGLMPACVGMDKLSKRALVFLPAEQERGMITCQTASWMSGAPKALPHSCAKVGILHKRGSQIASSIWAHLLLGCRNLSFEISLLLCPFVFYFSVFL